MVFFARMKRPMILQPRLQQEEGSKESGRLSLQLKRKNVNALFAIRYFCYKIPSSSGSFKVGDDDPPTYSGCAPRSLQYEGFQEQNVQRMQRLNAHDRSLTVISHWLPLPTYCDLQYGHCVCFRGHLITTSGWGSRLLVIFGFSSHEPCRADPPAVTINFCRRKPRPTP